VGATGELVAVDTSFATALKGVGKVQTVLDCFSRFVWARLYTTKIPLTAVQTLNNQALPFFEEHAVKVQTILSDNGREYCGRPDKHPYELFLQPSRRSNTAQRRSAGPSPTASLSGSTARSSKSISGSRAGRPGTRGLRRCRRTWMLSWRPITARGPRGMKGRTPYEVFEAGIPKKPRTRKPSARKEAKTAA